MYTINERIRYSECTMGKELTWPALLNYLQDACIFQSEEVGAGVERLVKEKRGWSLTSWQIQVIKMPVYGMKVSINTWPYMFKGFLASRNFTVTGENGEILVKADSQWVFMDFEKRRPSKIPPEIGELYTVEEKLDMPLVSRKIEIPTNTENEAVKENPVPVIKLFIDTNGHMNNEKYILIAESFVEKSREYKNLRVEYKKEAVLGDIIYPTVIKLSDGCVVTLADENGENYAVVEMKK